MIHIIYYVCLHKEVEYISNELLLASTYVYISF